MDEEFHNGLLASGPNVARRSYWREVFRNMWALAKRSSTIQVLALAAVAVFVFTLTLSPVFHWLDTFYIVSQVIALKLFLLALYETTIALLLGVLMSRFPRGRERILRLAFTGFYLLTHIGIYLFITWPHVFDIELISFTLNVVNWSLILTAFWLGNVWVSKRSVRQRAA